MSNPRILIVRTSALGDIVQALPVLTALRRRYPEARIGWVIEETFASLLDGHPDLDEVVTVRLRAWRRRLFDTATWRAAGALVNRLHEFAADVVIDLMGNHKAGVIAALTLCDRRIGLARPFRREPSSAAWISQPVAAHGEHAVDRMLSVLDGLDVTAEPADFAGHILAEEAGDWLPPSPPYVLIHPATGWKNKDYPPDRWATVARRLAARDVAVLIAPGPGEEALGKSIQAAGGGAALPTLALPSLVYLQRRAALVLGGDTGPIHLAHALGTPVLCLMGPTDPARHGPYGAPELTMTKRLACSFCHKRFNSVKACLLEIDADEVADRALHMLDGALH